MLRINGKNVKRNENFRFGYRLTLEGSDLIVWVKTDSTEPVLIELTPCGK